METLISYVKHEGAIFDKTSAEIYDLLKAYDSTFVERYASVIAFGKALGKSIDGEKRLDIQGRMLEGKVLYSIGLRQTLSRETPEIKTAKIRDNIVGKYVNELCVVKWIWTNPSVA